MTHMLYDGTALSFTIVSFLSKMLIFFMVFGTFLSSYKIIDHS